ncbi:hypothetical protein [Sporomusa sphaeroides]|jgi:hypothetical protein|uniref:hypothetical protein n=1 Tax=Sporomusa sphaeroides TaxID=47679 RepID=UPI0031596032
MYIIATYRQSLNLELAVARLEEQGLGKANIMAVPLQCQRTSVHVLTSMQDTDGLGLVGGSLAFGTVTMVLATIYGFVWYWGPIVWGLIGLFCGTGLWLTGSIIFRKRKWGKNGACNTGFGQIVLIIRCEPSELQAVKNILSDNMAQAIGILER